MVTAAVDGEDTTKVNFTAKNKGTVGNSIDIRVNYQAGQELPGGVTATIVAMASGATDPDISEIIAVLGEEQFNVVMIPWLDATNLTALETELADRWGPVSQNDGVAISAKAETVANLGTFGNSRNSPHLSVVGFSNSPTPPCMWAAAIGARVAMHGQEDPARPFQTLGLEGILPPPETSRFTIEEQDLLLHDGISTFSVDAGGVVRIQRLITTYKTNALGADDEAYLDLNTPLTLSYLRYDFRNTMLRKFPRHKLADDGTKFAPGQAVVTPKVARAEAIAIFRRWEEKALVENAAQFKRDLIVERNGSNPNRLDFMLPPDLVNQLITMGAQISFIL